MLSSNKSLFTSYFLNIPNTTFLTKWIVDYNSASKKKKVRDEKTTEKGQAVNILGFVGHIASVSTCQFYCYSREADVDVCKQTARLCSNTILFTKTDNRLNLACGPFFVDPDFHK